MKSNAKSFEPFIIKNFYSKELIELLQLQCQNLISDPNVPVDEKEFKRKFVHRHGLFEALHFLMNDRMEKVLKRKLKPSYSFVSMYFESNGFCPKHTDRPQCKYTVDLCIDQKKPWSFFAENTKGETLKFDLEIGDALILSGTDHVHWREKIQKKNFCNLAFFHFVDQNYQGGLD